jgi:hypothetical protein
MGKTEIEYQDKRQKFKDKSGNEVKTLNIASGEKDKRIKNLQSKYIAR